MDIKSAARNGKHGRSIAFGKETFWGLTWVQTGFLWEEGADNSGLTQHFPFLFVGVQELAPLLLQHMLQPLELFNVQWLQADQLVPQQQSSLLLAVHTSMPRNTAQTDTCSLRPDRIIPLLHPDRLVPLLHTKTRPCTSHTETHSLTSNNLEHRCVT